MCNSTRNTVVRHRPQEVCLSSGSVLRAESLLRTRAVRPCEFIRAEDGEAPFVILDMGPESCGGYPCIEVADCDGPCTLRLSYSNWYPHIVDEVHGEIGDCRRRYDNTYLNIDLPVLPGNPDRFELYGIHEAGVHVHPLLQGQTRWLRVQLDTPGSRVAIAGIWLADTDPREAITGSFRSDDLDINNLWQASAHTLQIASIANSHAWEHIEGWLAPRFLDQVGGRGLSRVGQDWTDYDFSCDVVLRANPNHDSGLGCLVRADDAGNGYCCHFDVRGQVRFERLDQHQRSIVKEQSLPAWPHGKRQQVLIRCRGQQFQVFVDGALILEAHDDHHQGGRVGFLQAKEEWALVREILVADGRGEALLPVEAAMDLDSWAYATTEPFISDGALRDRTPWLGDMYWAGRNAYAVFGDQRHVAGTLEIFARHQLANGHVWATAFPQNRQVPADDDFGLWPSDEFSCWYAVVVADYVLYTGDVAQAERYLPGVLRSLDYMFAALGADGLYYQAPETGRGQGKGHGDFGSVDSHAITYTNVLLTFACERAAELARCLSDQGAAEQCTQRAAALRTAIDAQLWHAGGPMRRTLRDDSFSFQANALALSIGWFEHEQAVLVAEALSRSHATGKFTSLAIEGCFRYGLDDLAFSIMRDPRNNWLNICNDQRGIQGATWESCIYPPRREAGDEFRDMSHPDTSIAHLLSEYVLGIRPLQSGMRRVLIQPHLGDVTELLGRVPTPQGFIECQWRQERDSRSILGQLHIPDGCTAELHLPGQEPVLLSSGEHQVQTGAPHAARHLV